MTPGDGRGALAHQVDAWRSHLQPARSGSPALSEAVPAVVAHPALSPTQLPSRAQCRVYAGSRRGPERRLAECVGAAQPCRSALAEVLHRRRTW